MAVLGRPGAPALPVVLGQGAEAGVGLQLVALGFPPALEAQVGAEVVPQGAEGLPLERPHPVPVQQRGGVEAPGLGPGRGDLGAGGRPRQVLDAQRQRGEPAPAGREVRAGLDPGDRERGVQRVDRHHARAAACGPGADGAQVGEVADAPALGRAARRELDRQGPGPQVVRQGAAAGRDDQAGDRAAVERVEIVVADGQVGRQRPLGPGRGAVLQPQLTGSPQRFGRARPHHPERVWGRRGTFVAAVRARAHGGPQGGARLGRRGVPVALHVEVPVVDAPGVGGHRRARYLSLPRRVTGWRARAPATAQVAGEGARNRVTGSRARAPAPLPGACC